MTHGSLFSGIGGFDLAAEWMDWENVFHCEYAEYPKKILKQHFPDAISYDDIKQTDFTIHRNQIGLLSGGFPCQPYSTAGKRLGKEDERHLWPEMLRAIREISPRWIVGENVRGLTNWNGGVVFDEVQADLEAEGYEVLPFLLPACAKNAPHRRDRIWIIAYSAGNDDQREQRSFREADGRQVYRRLPALGEPGGRLCSEGPITHPASNGWKRHKTFQEFHDSWIRERLVQGYGPQSLLGSGASSNPESQQDRRIQQSGLSAHIGTSYQRNASDANFWGLERRQGEAEGKYTIDRDPWRQFPTQSPVCGGNDGIPNRVDRIKGLGNAIVPQVAYQIFIAIEAYEQWLLTNDNIR